MSILNQFNNPNRKNLFPKSLSKNIQVVVHSFIELETNELELWATNIDP